MKYIDAEKLIAEIYKCREDALSVVDIDKANNLIEVIELIEDLQQEQPLTTEKVVEQCKKFGGNPEIIHQEQADVDLEKSRNLIRDALNGVTRLGSLCDDQTIEHAVDNLINRLGLNAKKKESVSVAESPSKTFPRVNEFDCGSSYRS